MAPLFAADRVTGRALAARHAESIFGLSGFNGFSTTRVFLVVVVHVVGILDSTSPGGFRPVVDQAWIDTLFRVANRIWGQACIELVPFLRGV